MSIHVGAWRYQIPRPLEGIISNNTLKYTAEIIPIYINIIEGHTKKEDCVIDLCDSYSTIGWTLKSNLNEIKQSEQVISTRKLSTIVINAEIYIYGQYFKGIWNFFTECLSKDHHLPDYQLTCFLLSI